MSIYYINTFVGIWNRLWISLHHTPTITISSDRATEYPLPHCGRYSQMTCLIVQIIKKYISFFQRKWITNSNVYQLFRKRSKFSATDAYTRDTCWHLLTVVTHAGTCWHMVAHAGPCWHMLTHANTCWHMLTHADTCWYMLTHAGTCWHILAHVDTCWHLLTHADTCWHMLTDADSCHAAKLSCVSALGPRRFISYRIKNVS